jgi:hypothetical protein
MTETGSLSRPSESKAVARAREEPVDAMQVGTVPRSNNGDGI